MSTGSLATSSNTPSSTPAYMDVDWSFDEAMDHYRDTGSFLFPHGGGMQMDVFREALERGELPGTHRHAGYARCLPDACPARPRRGTRHHRFHPLRRPGRGRHQHINKPTDARCLSPSHASSATTSRGFERSFVIATADDLGIRASRWIDGEFRFTGEMYDSPSQFPDAVGRSVPLRGVVKHKGERAWNAAEMLDFTFDVPYRCLVPAGVDGLLMGAGRSISIDNPWRLRLMVYTMVIGQGAGVGAAVAAASGARGCRSRHSSDENRVDPSGSRSHLSILETTMPQKPPNMLFILSDQHRYCSMPGVEGVRGDRAQLRAYLRRGR